MRDTALPDDLVRESNIRSCDEWFKAPDERFWFHKEQGFDQNAARGIEKVEKALACKKIRKLNELKYV